MITSSAGENTVNLEATQRNKKFKNYGYDCYFQQKFTKHLKTEARIQEFYKTIASYFKSLLV